MHACKVQTRSSHQAYYKAFYAWFVYINRKQMCTLNIYIYVCLLFVDILLGKLFVIYC